MAVIPEVTAAVGVATLVLKAHEFLFRLPDKWYQGTSEIKSFKSDLSILTDRAAQWEKQLNQHGMSEDPILKALLTQAFELLDAEGKYYETHQKRKLWKVRTRIFPGKLTYILGNVLKIVEAGPKLLAESVQTHDLLAKKSQLEPLELPFGYDRPYVPLQNAIDKVQEALAAAEGPQVVTLHGEPGTGKSSLAKYVALLYQDSIRRSTSCSFDGVHYIYCGRGCGKNIHELQRTLFTNLGVRARLPFRVEGEEERYDLSCYQSALRRVLGNKRLLIILDDVWSEDSKDLVSLVSLGTRCKYLLTSQTRNIWPDTWCIHMPLPTDEQALEIITKHLQACSTNRHLQASSSDNHLQASSSRNYSQAPSSGGHSHRFLRNNHLEKLPSQSQAPSNATDLKEIEIVREVIWELGNHPLALVNVAIFLGRNGPIDSARYKFLAKHMFAILEQDYERRPILVYERPYSLSVSDTMMLMVKSLPKTARNVLVVTSMLAGSGVSENLVRFFMRRFSNVHPSQFTSEYMFALNFLENNSLVQVHRSRPWSDSIMVDSEEIRGGSLTIHKLRRDFIRRNCLPELDIVLSNVVIRRGDHHHDTSLGNVQDDHQFLAITFGALFFAHDVVDALAGSVQSGMAEMSLNGDGVPRRLGQDVALSMSEGIAPLGPDQVAMSGGVVPRGLQQPQVNAREVVESKRLQFQRWENEACLSSGIFWDLWEAMKITVGLLNLEGEELWKQQARSHASKIGTAFVLQRQLDDASIASLLTIPYTTDAASRLFCFLYDGGGGRDDLKHGFHFGQRKSLSDTLPATWNALSNLLYSKKLPISSRAGKLSMANTIWYMLEFETESKVSEELGKLRELACQSSDLLFQNEIHQGFIFLHGSRLNFQVVNALNLQEFLPDILWKLILDHHEDHVGDWTWRRVRREHHCSVAFDMEFTYPLVIACISNDRDYAETLLRYPISGKEWLTDAALFRRLLKLEAAIDSRDRYWKARHGLLAVLSDTAEFRIQAAAILKDERWKEVDFTLWPESYHFQLAPFWGNVALLEDIDDTTSLRLAKIATDWVEKVSACYPNGVTCIDWNLANQGEIPGDMIPMNRVSEVLRAVTIISRLHANTLGPLINSPLRPVDEMRMESTREACVFCVEACRGQAEAYCRLEMYDEAVSCLDRLDEALSRPVLADLNLKPVG